MMLFVECVCLALMSVSPLHVCILLYVCLQSKVEGKTAAAVATSGDSRAATPTDKKDKPRSERKRVSHCIFSLFGRF